MPGGAERLERAFREPGRPAFLPYVMGGWPDPATSARHARLLARHADVIELGIPFSDPLADGPTIQHSTQVALEGGTTLADCLAMLRELRRRGVAAPVLLFGYYNPFLAYGLPALARDARAAGAQGFIVPDLPLDEAADLEAAATGEGLALIQFLAPTSSAPRIAAVCARARGFIYLGSVTGTTGARAALQGDLAGFIGRVRAQTATPLAVGVGISTPQQAATVGRLADGVIVGSALVNAVDAAGDKPAAAAAFVRALAEAQGSGGAGEQG